VSGEFADWSRLPEEAEVVAFADHLDDEDAVAERLAGFDVVVAMRERTPFPRSLLERLPRLRLLVTTGARNAAIDVAAAAETLQVLRSIDASVLRAGAFGPEVPAPADADVVTELMCFAGRQV